MGWVTKKLRRDRTQPPGSGPPGAVAADDSVADAAVARRAAVRALESGSPEAALRAAQSGLERHPDDPELSALAGHANLGLGRAEDALDDFTLALHYDPRSESAYRGLVLALDRLGRLREIEIASREYLARNPDSDEAFYQLGRVAQVEGRFDEAEAALEQALALNPTNKHALNFLGLIAAREFADFERGESRVRQALALDPDYGAALANLGWILNEQRRYDEGMALLRRALTVRAGGDEVRFLAATADLKRGEFAAGWDAYDARFADPTAAKRPFGFPAWDGSRLREGALLVFGEQGLGDQIMFASCIPDAMARVERCVIECEPRLAPIFARSFPGARVYPGRLSDPLPAWLTEVAPIGAQAPVGSLPGFFRRHRDAFLPHQGYLKADASKVARWRDRLDRLGGRRSIGVSWRGGWMRSRRQLRSLDLAALAPVLLGVDAEFVSLQYNDCAAELAGFKRATGKTVWHWQEAIDDYDETAALVCALDGIVTVCTALVHLAGALARPAIVLVPYSAEWRYGDQGEAMVWYPSVRLLRQRAPNGWEPVVTEARDRLRAGAFAPPASAVAGLERRGEGIG